MEVILKEDIKNLGEIGDVVSVKPGYGRNFLVPQGKAVFATADNLKNLEKQKEELRKKQEGELSILREKAQTFEGLKLTIEANVTEEGTLYGSIGIIDIANAANEKGIELERSYINMPDGPIKTIGSHDVELLFHPEIQVIISVEVVGGEVAIKNTLDSEEEEDNINEENIDTENTEESE
ncbi:MAG: 50S ribosomal protein L9 [Gammaproteobacteria bacterium]|nr:50S ribosomal protein L9 [Gammaproteobacteria bacterium]OUT92738.1 MAG: 50S ribosomal protein L9 [Gammaproteobacteria bacterium TMED36]